MWDVMETTFSGLTVIRDTATQEVFLVGQLVLQEEEEHYILQREPLQQLPADWDEEKRSSYTEQKALAHKSRAEQQDTKSREGQGAILKTDLLIHHPQDNQAKALEHLPPTPIGEAPEPANRFGRGCRRRILCSLVTAQTLSKTARTLSSRTSAT
ncbi:MAG: hypothetical protein J3Q66DRAFT_368233 [Benniella sp.]|nr:MAG: hypothetical protein J3Q66DRAFT_368233 [Benniella sp.]